MTTAPQTTTPNDGADMLVACAKTVALCRAARDRQPKNFHAQEMLSAAEHGYSVARNLHGAETARALEDVERRIVYFGKWMHDELRDSTRAPSPQGKAMHRRVAARHQRDLVVAVMTLAVMKETQE